MSLRVALIVLALILIAALSLGLAGQDAASPLRSDQKAVHRAVQDYLEALYDCKPELIERSVSKDLTKFGFWRPDSETPYRSMPMTYAQLHELAGKWNKEGTKVTADSPRKITVLNCMDQTAAARLDAEWGMDYMHLAKYDGKWEIVHVLWQSKN